MNKPASNLQMAQALAVLVVFFAVGAFLAVVFIPYLDFGQAEDDVSAVTPGEEDKLPMVLLAEDFLPPEPGDAPEPLKSLVLAGYRQALGRGLDAPDVVRNTLNPLSCNSCHFRGGITEGGLNEGFSLVGATARYPRVMPDGSFMDISGRVNKCVTMHMGQEPWTTDSPQMQAAVAYLSWISEGVPQYAKVTWLDVEPLAAAEGKVLADATELYSLQCVRCHLEDGAGSTNGPPLWGDKSFTSGGDMAGQGTLARFIYQNMPRGGNENTPSENPILSEQQAVELAALILGKPRPGRATTEVTDTPKGE